MDAADRPTPRVLLTGATGYVGGRLLAVLTERGEAVRCMARRPANLVPRVDPATQVVAGDVLDRDSLVAAMQGIEVAYYLVHALGSSGDFAEQEQRGARNFADAARQAGVQRIVYLGGLSDDADVSPHLASRREVGRILRESGVPTLEFRASIIIGSGSLSFELIRALSRKLPVMVVPRWGYTLSQPIAIEDVIDYLVAAKDRQTDASRVYEIGGPDCVRYVDLLQEYSRQRGLKRLMIGVPVLTPRLSSLWLALVTPVYARIGRKLIDSTSTPSVVRDGAAMTDFDVRPRGYAEAIARALAFEDQQFARTHWSDALSATGPVRTFGGRTFGSRLIDSRTASVPAAPREAFAPVRRIGGKSGWYYGDWLWRLRGVMDAMLGGVGLRRGRRDPEHATVGDALDFWRVEAYEPDRLLRLRAEMRLPGRAWLQFEVTPEAQGGSTIRQTAMFDPLGLVGLLYWYALWPLHQFVFAGMLRAIADRASQGSTDRPAAPVVAARERHAGR